MTRTLIVAALLLSACVTPTLDAPSPVEPPDGALAIRFLPPAEITRQGPAVRHGERLVGYTTTTTIGQTVYATITTPWPINPCNIAHEALHVRIAQEQAARGETVDSDPHHTDARWGRLEACR